MIGPGKYQLRRGIFSASKSAYFLKCSKNELAALRAAGRAAHLPAAAPRRRPGVGNESIRRSARLFFMARSERVGREKPRP